MSEEFFLRALNYEKAPKSLSIQFPSYFKAFRAAPRAPPAVIGHRADSNLSFKKFKRVTVSCVMPARSGAVI